MNKDKMVLFCDLMLCGIERRLELIQDDQVRDEYTNAYMQLCTELTEIDFDDDENASKALIDLTDTLYTRHTLMSRDCM